jgi:hypothetical protein
MEFKEDYEYLDEYDWGTDEEEEPDLDAEKTELEVERVLGKAFSKTLRTMDEVEGYGDLLELFRNENGPDSLKTLDQMTDIARTFDNYEAEGIDDTFEGSFDEAMEAVAADIIYEPHNPKSSTYIKALEGRIIEKIKAHLTLRINKDVFFADIGEFKLMWLKAKKEERDQWLRQAGVEENEVALSSIETDENLLESLRLHNEAKAFELASNGTLETLALFEQVRDDYSEIINETLPKLRKNVREGKASRDELAMLINTLRDLRWKRDGMMAGLEAHGLKRLQTQVIGYKRTMRTLSADEKKVAKTFIRRVGDFIREMEEEEEEAEERAYRNQRIVLYHDRMGGGYLPDNWEIVVDQDAGDNEDLYLYRNLDTGDTSVFPPNLDKTGHDYQSDLRRQNVVISMLDARLRNLQGEIDDELRKKDNWKAIQTIKDEVSKVALDLTYSWFNNRRSDAMYAGEMEFIMRRVTFLRGIMDDLIDEEVEAKFDEEELVREAPKIAAELQDEREMIAEAAAQHLKMQQHQYFDVISAPMCDLNSPKRVQDQYHFPCTSKAEKGTYPSACLALKDKLICPINWYPDTGYKKQRVTELYPVSGYQTNKVQRRRATGPRQRVSGKERRRQTGGRR